MVFQEYRVRTQIPGRPRPKSWDFPAIPCLNSKNWEALDVHFANVHFISRSWGFPFGGFELERSLVATSLEGFSVTGHEKKYQGHLFEGITRVQGGNPPLQKTKVVMSKVVCSGLLKEGAVHIVPVRNVPSLELRISQRLLP